LKSQDWSGATARNYGIGDLGQLQNVWLAWVKQGMPDLRQRNVQPAVATSPEMLANNRPAQNVVPASYRQLQPAKNNVTAQNNIVTARNNAKLSNNAIGPQPVDHLASQMAAVPPVPANNRLAAGGRQPSAVPADPFASRQSAVATVAANSTNSNVSPNSQLAAVPAATATPFNPQAAAVPAAAASPDAPADSSVPAAPFTPQVSQSDQQAAPTDQQFAQAQPSESIQTGVSRPQEMEQPHQVILQWQR
jgi:hypothetical protein